MNKGIFYDPEIPLAGKGLLALFAGQQVTFSRMRELLTGENPEELMQILRQLLKLNVISDQTINNIHTYCFPEIRGIYGRCAGDAQPREYNIEQRNITACMGDVRATCADAPVYNSNGNIQDYHTQCAEYNTYTESKEQCKEIHNKDCSLLNREGTESKNKRECEGERERETGRDYPASEEAVIEAAKGIDYCMSIGEARAFLGTYAPTGWRLHNQEIRDWRSLLFRWKSHQSMEEYQRALREVERRKHGLPAEDPYEYYEDAQGRLFRRLRSGGDWEGMRSDKGIA